LLIDKDRICAAARGKQGECMKRLVLSAMLLLPMLSAHAGVHGDDLTRCVVSSATHEEKLALVEWMFFAIALNPTIAPLAEIPPERRDAADRSTARLFEKLLSESCVEQARAAVKYEGNGAIGEAFKLLGQVAAQEMFADPAVSRGAEKFAEHIDTAKMAKALGLPDP
jgi:hypothetical protein